jgi:hypothetical protein
MKVLILILGLFFTQSLLAGTFFTATLIRNKTYLYIEMTDDSFVPPFEAGEMWKIVKGQDWRKWINEKEMQLDCQATQNQTGDTFGKCILLFPWSQFQKIGDKMVFKAEGPLAARLNQYFIDSAYLSMQRNQAYLSSYNTRRQFFFGIDEKLIDQSL